MKYDLDYYGFSEQGNRKINQDYVHYFKNNYNYLIVIIADGMGGHYGGEIASKVAIDAITDFFLDVNFNLLNEKKLKKLLIQSVKLSLSKMQELVLDDAKLADMGTTLNVNIFVEDVVYIINIGDSRTLSITKKFVNSVTIDQNLAALAKLNSKYNSYKSAKSILTSSLGPKKDLKIDLYKAKLNNFGYILVSSDGVHNYVSDIELLNITKEPNSLEDKVREIINLSYENGSNDNMSCILVKYHAK